MNWLNKNLPQMLLAAALFLQAGIATAEAARLAVISDINGRYGSADYHPRLDAAIARIIELEPDLVISTGDMVAGQRPSPKLTRAELDNMWQSFHRRVRTPLESAGIPVLMTPGNHDASGYPGYELEREAYINYHRRHPSSLAPLPGGQFPFYFAIAHGELLLVSLDATRSGPLDQAQRNWLSNLLQQYGDSRGILFGHLPLQPVARGREQDIVTDPQLEALLTQHNVSAYLSGHHHAWYPGQRLETAMLSIGNLGGNQRALIDTNQKTGFSFALLEIDDGKLRSISAYAAPGFRQTVDNTLLPEHLGTGPAQLQRLDLDD